MNRCRNFMEIIPERLYSVSEAARLLHVHRCTIYTYITFLNDLYLIRLLQATDLFQGTELIAFNQRTPQEGRKRNELPINRRPTAAPSADVFHIATAYGTSWCYSPCFESSFLGTREGRCCKPARRLHPPRLTVLFIGRVRKTERTPLRVFR